MPASQSVSSKVTYLAVTGHWTAIKISFDARPFYSRGIHYSSGTVRVRWVMMMYLSFLWKHFSSYRTVLKSGFLVPPSWKGSSHVEEEDGWSQRQGISIDVWVAVSL